MRSERDELKISGFVNAHVRCTTAHATNEENNKNLLYYWIDLNINCYKLKYLFTFSYSFLRI